MFFQKLFRRLLDCYVYQISIKHRLMIYFVAAILIPTIVISFILYRQSSWIIASKIDVSLEKNLKTAEQVILQQFDSLQDIVNMISMNDDLRGALNPATPQDLSKVTDEIRVLEKILDSYFLTVNYSASKAIIIPRIYMLNRSVYNRFNFSEKIFDISLIEKEEWYQRLPEAFSYKIVGTDKVQFRNHPVDTIKVAKRLYALKYDPSPYTALLTVDVETEYFNRILESIKASDRSRVFIMNDTGIIVADSFRNNIGKKVDGSISKLLPEKVIENYVSKLGDLNGEEVLLSAKRIEKADWVMISVSPINDLNKELMSFNRIMMIVLFGCMLLALVTALFLSGNISRPIQKLVKAIPNIKEGRLDMKIDYKRKDEFTYLIESYKNMLEEIKELIDRLYVSEIVKKDAELKALQAQINPHFLYNTLESVNSMAKLKGVDEISKIVISLSELLRVSISNPAETITIEQEVAYLKRYLHIQEVRFFDRFESLLEVDEALVQYRILKLILQPLVENCLVHGIEDMEEPGLITISIKDKGEFLEISVSDNGLGMDEDELRNLYRHIRGEGSLSKVKGGDGVKNVNDRLRLHYGEVSALRIDSSKGRGTTVMFAIPK